MNNKKIIRLLRQADAEKIAENWPFPDEKAGERIYAKRQNPGELPMEDIVQDEVLIERRSGAGRFAAIAAVCLLTVGTVGGIGLMRHMHSQEPVTELPAAEEELTAGTQPETAELPVIATVYAEDRAASEANEQPESTAGEPEAFSQEAEQTATDASEPAAVPEKRTVKPDRKPAETTAAKQSATGEPVRETATEAVQAETAARDPRLEQVYQLLLPFAEAHSEMTVIRAGEFWDHYFTTHPDAQQAKNLEDNMVVLEYPNAYHMAYRVDIRYFLQENGIDDVVAINPLTGTDSQLSDQRITLEEAKRICMQSSDAWEAARTIGNRYRADLVAEAVKDYSLFYFDGTQTEGIMIRYGNGVHIYHLSRKDDPLPNRVLATTGNAPALYPASQISMKNVSYILRWIDTELGKNDPELSDEQVTQLRALEEEEKSLWTTKYIRRRLEIVGALSDDAPRLTLEQAEELCEKCGKNAEFCSMMLMDRYVPDYECGSGVDRNVYVLSDHETINVVNKNRIYYEDTASDPPLIRQLCE